MYSFSIPKSSTSTDWKREKNSREAFLFEKRDVDKTFWNTARFQQRKNVVSDSFILSY